MTQQNVSRYAFAVCLGLVLGGCVAESQDEPVAQVTETLHASGVGASELGFCDGAIHDWLLDELESLPEAEGAEGEELSRLETLCEELEAARERYADRSYVALFVVAEHVVGGVGYVLYDLDAIRPFRLHDIVLERNLEIGLGAGSVRGGYAAVGASIHLPRRNYDGVAFGGAGYQCTRAWCAGAVGLAWTDNRGHRGLVALPFGF
jgi:hypothetical protein